MGLLSRFKLASSVATAQANGEIVAYGGASLGGTSTVGILSPWSEGQLAQFVWSDIFGTEFKPVNRMEAMSLPPVAKARALIVGELANKRLVAVDKNGVLKTQPTWLYRTDSGSGVSPWHRMSHTYDDWIFYGQSLWVIQRGANGQITDAAHLPYERWEVDALGQILVSQPVTDNRGNVTLQKLPVDAAEVLLLPGPFEGLLNVGQTSIRAAKDLELSWAGKARTPAPAIVLQETSDSGMTQLEVDAYVTAVSKARRDPNGAVMFLPHTINATFEGNVASDLMIEGRNAARLDVAAFLNLPASALDAALPKASLNYETQEGTEITLADRLDYWTAPFEARLSTDDVCPRGQFIRFDFSDLPTNTAPDTGPYAED